MQPLSIEMIRVQSVLGRECFVIRQGGRTVNCLCKIEGQLYWASKDFEPTCQVSKPEMFKIKGGNMITKEQALTPPTEEEVCKALGELVSHKVEYVKANKTFMYITKSNCEYTYCRITELCDGKIRIASGEYPPRLITMIGQFYEGVMKNETN